MQTIQLPKFYIKVVVTVRDVGMYAYNCNKEIRLRDVVSHILLTSCGNGTVTVS